MSLFRLRWAVPAGVLVIVLVVAGSIAMIRANASPTLPPRSAAQLLTDLANSLDTQFSGTVVQKSELGLPSIPTPFLAGSSAGPPLTALLNGSNTMRIWYGGPNKVRLALVNSLGESDVIRNGDDLWAWSSADKSAVHIRLDSNGTPAPLPSSPAELATDALQLIEPTTKVYTDGTAEVAGRPAYELVLEPRDSAVTIGQVRLAVDAERHIPLRVRVFARGTEAPAFEMGFTRISFDRPDVEQFQFVPPPGTDVGEADLSTGTDKPEDNISVDRSGSGWTTVLIGRFELGGSSIAEALPAVKGTWGTGRLVRSNLFSVLFVDDGRVLAGFVAPERLYEVAAATR